MPSGAARSRSFNFTGSYHASLTLLIFPRYARVRSPGYFDFLTQQYHAADFMLKLLQIGTDRSIILGMVAAGMDIRSCRTRRLLIASIRWVYLNPRNFQVPMTWNFSGVEATAFRPCNTSSPESDTRSARTSLWNKGLRILCLEVIASYFE